MASTTSNMTKVTSFGSQSGTPSAPNPTPTTEALDSDVTDPTPPMDFAAVTRILAPVTEELNEAADVAMLPSPPVSTPVVGSPTPSVRWPLPQRSRGLSLIGDRLAQLKIDARKSRCRRDGEVTTSSLFSDEPSIAEDNESDMASISEVMSDVLSEGCKDKICAQCPGHVRTSLSSPLASPLGLGSVPIALGSPVLNPRIEEYLSFTSKDLPTHAPEPVTGATLAEHASSTSATALDADSMRSHGSFNDDGVTEKSNWAEELEDAFTRTLLRFEQLAMDENAADPSKDAADYYVSRLSILLGNSKRQVPVKIEKVEKMVEEAQQKQ
jgi:hypothetical protein